jgi:hypothetical protein
MFCNSILFEIITITFIKLSPVTNVESTDGFPWNFVWTSLLLKPPHIRNPLFPAVNNTSYHLSVHISEAREKLPIPDQVPEIS